MNQDEVNGWIKGRNAALNHVRNHWNRADIGLIPIPVVDEPIKSKNNTHSLTISITVGDMTQVATETFHEVDNLPDPRINIMMEVIEVFAKQKLSSEMQDPGGDYDYDYAYETMVRIARRTLDKIK